MFTEGLITTATHSDSKTKLSHHILIQTILIFRISLSFSVIALIFYCVTCHLQSKSSPLTIGGD